MHARCSNGLSLRQTSSVYFSTSACRAFLPSFHLVHPFPPLERASLAMGFCFLRESRSMLFARIKKNTPSATHQSAAKVRIRIPSPAKAKTVKFAFISLLTSSGAGIVPPELDIVTVPSFRGRGGKVLTMLYQQVSQSLVL